MAIISGVGNLFDQNNILIAEASYKIEETLDMPGGLKKFRGSIKILKGGDKFWPISSGTRFTLHLKDERKLDLYCFRREITNSICDIEGQNDFYS
jgi:hypothetical protein